MGDDVTRGAWVQVHLWLGLTLGVLGVLVGITGSILVFDRDIDAMLNPQRYGTSGAQVALPLSEYAANAARALGGRARATLIRLPEARGKPVVVFARGQGEGGGQYRVYLDPPTGRVLEAVPGGGFVGWVRGFHENLSLREYFGREIVGVAGVAMLVSSLSGLYLWWPGRGRFTSALGFRRGLPLNRNLHYFFGFYGFLMLAMLSFTGIFVAFTDAGRALVAVFAPLSPPARNVQSSSERALKPLSIDEAVAIAKSLHPAEEIWSVGLPAGPRGTYRINLSEPGVPSMQAGRGTVVFVDPGSGAIPRRVDASTRTGGDNFLVLQRTLHSGEPFGVLGRALICVVGLLPGLFVVTGSLMWLRQRRAQQKLEVA